MNVIYIYLRERRYKVNNGRNVSFLWIGDKPMCIVYPMLFDLCSCKKCPVYEIAQKA
jgi:hypothetical protein